MERNFKGCSELSTMFNGRNCTKVKACRAQIKGDADRPN